MKPEDWQAYQAQRTGEAPRPAAPTPPPPYQQARPAAKQPRSGMGWPLAILLLGLAMVGGCCYSFARLADSVSPFETISSGPSVGVMVVENEIVGSIWATEVVHKFKNDKNIKAVVIRINGKHEVQEVVIADDLMDHENKDMLQDLITVAFGKAEEKLAADREAKMGAITGGVSFPGM